MKRIIAIGLCTLFVCLPTAVAQDTSQIKQKGVLIMFGGSCVEASRREGVILGAVNCRIHRNPPMCRRKTA